MPDKTIAVAEKKGSLRATNSPRQADLLSGVILQNREFIRFDEITWECVPRNSNEKGEKIFEQKNVEIPKTWSMTATNVVVSNTFMG